MEKPKNKKTNYVVILTLLLSIPASVGAFFSVLNYVQDWTATPILTYEVQPNENLETVIIIRNNGQTVATNVRITVECNAIVNHTSYTSPEEIEILGDGSQDVVAKLNRLSNGVEVYLQLTFSESNTSQPVEYTSITSDQGSGTEHNLYIDNERSQTTTIQAIFALVILLIIISLTYNLARRKRWKIHLPSVFQKRQ